MIRPSSLLASSSPALLTLLIETWMGLGGGEVDLLERAGEAACGDLVVGYLYL